MADEPAKPAASPYREERSLGELIPPDRRRLKSVLVVLLSMAAGAALFHLVERASVSLRVEPIVTSSGPPAKLKRLDGFELTGPRSRVRFSGQTAMVVHVWLQGCLDCMPAFDAIYAIEKTGGLDVNVPVVNVAYGEADEKWSREHGVATNLVFDTGGKDVVKPLGIGTFTTLVVDRCGYVVHTDRPDRVGFAARIATIVRETESKSFCSNTTSGEHRF